MKRGGTIRWESHQGPGGSTVAVSVGHKHQVRCTLSARYPPGYLVDWLRHPRSSASAQFHSPCGCPPEGGRTPPSTLRKGEISCAVPPRALPAARPATPDAVNTLTRSSPVSRSNSAAAAQPTPALAAADLCCRGCSGAKRPNGYYESCPEQSPGCCAVLTCRVNPTSLMLFAARGPLTWKASPGPEGRGNGGGPIRVYGQRAQLGKGSNNRRCHSREITASGRVTAGGRRYPEVSTGRVHPPRAFRSHPDRKMR